MCGKLIEKRSIVAIEENSQRSEHTTAIIKTSSPVKIKICFLQVETFHLFLSFATNYTVSNLLLDDIC